MQGDEHSSPAAKRILIVEDNDLNLKLLHDVVQAHGYVPITARRGAMALELARADRPDLILMDLQLPDLSGLDVVRLLKQDPVTKSIPVVAVTAFAMAGDEAKALTGGCDGYVAKPIELREFLEVVERFIGKAQPLR